MRVAWAIVAGLALGAGVAYWQQGNQPKRTAKEQAAKAHTADHADRANTSKPKPTAQLYRWRDDNGVLQITDHPPKDRDYERVDVRADQNIIRADAPVPEPPN